MLTVFGESIYLDVGAIMHLSCARRALSFARLLYKSRGLFKSWLNEDWITEASNLDCLGVFTMIPVVSPDVGSALDDRKLIDAGCSVES